jgi:glycosyltransferase involved in cell wall biosynthesis
MKVWVLDPAQLTPYYNIALCDALAQAGCDVRYMASRYLYDDHLPFTGHFQTDYIYFRGLYYPLLTRLPRLRRALRAAAYPLGHWQVTRQLRHAPPDVLHIQWSRVPRFDYWLIQQARLAGVPVVHTVHDVVPLYAPAADTGPLHMVYQAVDRVIVHTHANRETFVRTYPAVDPAKIAVVPLISTPYTALPADTSQARARAHLGLPADALVFLFFGSVRAYKGLDTLLTAFAQAAASRPDIHLLVAGRPESQADANLLATASDQERVHIVSGYIPYGDVWLYHKAADAAVLPYRAITQSAALVPPENAEALAVALLDAASDKARLRQMGLRSAALVAERHAGSAVAQQTIAVYRAAAG